METRYNGQGEDQSIRYSCPECRQSMEDISQPLSDHSYSSQPHAPVKKSQDYSYSVQCDGCQEMLMHINHQAGSSLVGEPSVLHCQKCQKYICKNCATRPVYCPQLRNGRTRACQQPMMPYTAAALLAIHVGYQQGARCNGCEKSILVFKNGFYEAGRSEYSCLWHCPAGHDLCLSCVKMQKDTSQARTDWPL